MGQWSLPRATWNGFYCHTMQATETEITKNNQGANQRFWIAHSSYRSKGVGIGRVGVEVPEAVSGGTACSSSEALPLFWSEASILFISLWVHEGQFLHEPR